MGLSRASAAPATPRILASLKRPRAQLEDAAGLDVRQRSFQGSDRRRRVGPSVLVRNKRRAAEPYGIAVDLHLKLGAFANAEATPNVDGQSDAPLAIDRDNASCHLAVSLYDEVSFRQNHEPHVDRRDPSASGLPRSESISRSVRRPTLRIAYTRPTASSRNCLVATSRPASSRTSRIAPVGCRGGREGASGW